MWLPTITTSRFTVLEPSGFEPGRLPLRTPSLAVPSRQMTAGTLKAVPELCRSAPATCSGVAPGSWRRQGDARRSKRQFQACKTVLHLVEQSERR